MSLTVIGAGLGGFIVGAGGTYALMQQRLRQVRAEKATLSAQLQVVADQLQQLQVQVTDLQRQVHLNAQRSAVPASTSVSQGHTEEIEPPPPVAPVPRDWQPIVSMPPPADEVAEPFPFAGTPELVPAVPGPLPAMPLPKAGSELPSLTPSATELQAGIAVPGVVQDRSEAEVVIACGSDIGVLSALLAALQHPDPLLRCDAASGLAALADELRPAQLRPLVQALGSLGQDPAAQVRLSSVKALAEICSPQVLPYLRQALRDADSDVVKAASQALEPYRGAKRQPPRSVRPKPQRRCPSQA